MEPQGRSNGPENPGLVRNERFNELAIEELAIER
jgi:hypothetical protein